MNLREALSKKLTKKEMENLKTSFDIIGDIAIIEVPPKLVKKQKIIAETLMKIHNNVKTVLKKGSERKGELRLRNLKYMAGRKSTVTLHTEFGCKYKLDVKKTYFSPRESTERNRIADLVKKGETVLVMFAGIAPFSILIAKRKDVDVYSVELNKDAHRYAKDNIHLNHVASKVEVVNGDVRKVCKSYYSACTRVIMPLPKEGYKFLDVAFKCVKPKGIIHFYFAGSIEEGEKHIKKVADKLNRKVTIKKRTRVLPYMFRY
jgi:tRNA (guanine37-N1)-methyltransferase